MSENARPESLVDLIRLACIEPVKVGPFVSGHKVTFDFSAGDKGPGFTAEFTMSGGTVTDDGMVALARHQLHELFAQIAHETAHWQMSADQIQSVMRESDGDDLWVPRRREYA